MNTRILRVLGTVAAAFLLVGCLGRLLASATAAGAEPEAEEIQSQSLAALQVPTPPPPPDPRWLALVRSTSPDALALQSGGVSSINLSLTDGSVAGRVTLASPVTISVTRAAAQIAHATAIPLPDEGSFFYLASLEWEWGSCSPCALQAGDVIWETQANTALSMTVPTLSALAAPESDTVYGAAPPGAAVTLYLFPYATPEASFTQTITADGTGQYQALWAPGVDLRPRDSGYVAYAQDASRRAYVRFVAPFLRAQVDGPQVSGMAAPYASVVITATDSRGAFLAQWYAYAYADGSFSYPGSYYPDGKGNCGEPGYGDLRLQPGDHITAEASSQTFSMTVGTVTAHADLTSGQVWGEGPAGHPVEVLHFGAPLRSGYDDLWAQTPAGQTIVTATTEGNYTATLPLSRADYGAAIITSTEGHLTYARFAVPYLWARLGEIGSSGPFPYLAWGQVDELSAPITFSVQGPSGYLKGAHALAAASNGYFDDYDEGYCYTQNEPIVLDSGDIITLTTLRGVQVALPLPRVTAQADPVSDTVSGQAPPGAQLSVTVYDWDYGGDKSASHVNAAGGGCCGPFEYTVIVTATAQGDYGVDFSALGGFSEQATGKVEYTTPEGHTVARVFEAPPSCAPGLTPIQVGGNALNIWMGYGCPGAVLRLRSSQGQVKFQGQIWPDHGYSLTLYDANGHPIPIMPGDTIEIETAGQTPFPIPATPPPSRFNADVMGAGNQLNTILVPTLTVSPDPQTKALTGQAPPGAVLSFQVIASAGYFYPDPSTLTTTVSAQGVYSVSLAGQYTLTSGSRVRVNYSSLEGFSFYADGVVPLAQAYLYHSQVQGWLAPLTPYTISDAITTQAGGYASTLGQFSAWLARMEPGVSLTITTPSWIWQKTLPFLSAQVDRATATVSGQAPSNARLQVSVNGDSQIVTATITGLYTATFPDLAPLQSAQGTLAHLNPDGFQTLLEFATPHWEIVLGSNCVIGYAQMPGAPMTVTLQAGDGRAKGSAQATPDITTGWFATCLPATVQPNDRLALIDPTGTTIFTVPNLTTVHDYARQALEGQAAPGRNIVATFQAAFSHYSAPIVRRAQADANGHYGMDTSDLGLQVGQIGYVVMTDEAGNTIQRDFTIQGYPVYLPLVAND